MSQFEGYMGQIYAPLTTPAGTPILVVPQGTRLSAWTQLVEAQGEAPALWYCHNSRNDAMWVLVHTGGMRSNIVGQLTNGYRFVWAIAGWVDLRNALRRMRGNGSAATFPQQLVGDHNYIRHPDFRVEPDMMPALFEGWDGTFTVAPY